MGRGEPFPLAGRIGFVRARRGPAAERLLHPLASAGRLASIRRPGGACRLSFARLRVGLRDAVPSFRNGSGRALSPIVRAHEAGPGKARIMGRTLHRRG